MDWKKPVREYIPEFRLQDALASDRVTVHDLLCHHSGLPRHDWIWLPGDMSPAQMLAAMRYLESSDDIRSTFQYSNLGYLVASMVAERVTSQSWAEFTRALTDRLHMEVTFTVEELAAAADAAVPYTMEGTPAGARAAYRRLRNGRPTPRTTMVSSFPSGARSCRCAVSQVPLR
jgi:CubicO group peptidase (beta-lactamase class C family)